MLQELGKELNHFVDRRVIEVDCEMFANNKKYIKLNKKLIKMQGEIEKCLPKGNKLLISKYDDIVIEQQILCETIQYIHGLIDGIKVGRHNFNLNPRPKLTIYSK
ncbi:MAG: hypothetical protein ACYDEQ_08990 [Desulfocucumaceae bacterium]